MLIYKYAIYVKLTHPSLCGWLSTENPLLLHHGISLLEKARYLLLEEVRPSMADATLILTFIMQMKCD